MEIERWREGERDRERQRGIYEGRKVMGEREGGDDDDDDLEFHPLGAFL